MPKYGLITDVDAKVLEQTIQLILAEFPNANPIEVTEIGIYSGETGNGIREFIERHDRKCFLTGVDNNKDGEKLRFRYDELLIGNSSEVYHKIEDRTQHLIFVDGDHSFAGVIADFFCYADKIRKDGYIAFHDTGKHIQPFKDFQYGHEDNPDAYISVRKALETIGLSQEKIQDYPVDEKMKIYKETGMWFSKYNNAKTVLGGWQLVFDEADETNPAGGICVFKKMY
jgi:hypothetical protein